MKRISTLILLLSLSISFTTAQCFSGDCIEGYGAEKFDGYTYRGFYKDGLFHGFGLVKYANGDIFKGAFEEGKIQGVGIIEYAGSDRDIYAEFEDGELNGYGIIVENGDVVEANKYKHGEVVKRMAGDYLNRVSSYDCMGNCKNGFGVEVYAEDDYYFGFFSGNSYTAVGVRKFSDGEVYKGGMKGSKRNGFGEYHYSSGNRYIGMWKGGDRHGPGAFVFADGSEQRGYYKNGKFVGEKE